MGKKLKQKVKKILQTFTVVIFIVSLAAASLYTTGNSTEAAGKKAVKSVSIKVNGVKKNKQAITVKKGKSLKLTASIRPAKAKKSVSWKSSNSSVASVKGGKVSAKKAGTARITVKVKGKNGKVKRAWVKIKVSSSTSNPPSSCSHKKWTVYTKTYQALQKEVYRCNGCGYPLYTINSDWTITFLPDLYVHPAKETADVTCTGGGYHNGVYEAGYCDLCGELVVRVSCAFHHDPNANCNTDRTLGAYEKVETSTTGACLNYFKSCKCGSNICMQGSESVKLDGYGSTEGKCLVDVKYTCQGCGFTTKSYNVYEAMIPSGVRHEDYVWAGEMPTPW